jgi:hypothetical protein
VRDLRLGRRAVLIGFGSSLAACGFEPVYRRSDPARGAALGAIAVDPVAAAPEDGRVGQILRNELLSLFAASGQAPARYRLEVQLASHAAPLAISSDDTITRYNVILEARVRLVALDTGLLVYRATARSVGSYDVQRSDYGTRIAEQATREDAARDLGRRIATMVAAVLAQGAA